MKTTLITLLLIVITMAPAPAQEPVADTLLATATLTPEGESPIHLEKILRGEEIFLQARVGSAPPFWTSEPLGSEEKKFLYAEKPASLIICDLDSDNEPEILTAAFYGPRASGLYGFQYQVDKKQFTAIPCQYPNPDDNRDLLVSDLHQEDGSDFTIAADGQIIVLGLIYAEGKEPAPGRFFFTCRNGAFHAGKTEPLSTADK